MRRHGLFLLLMFALSAVATARAQSARPLAGLDPGGTAVALIGTGIDFTKREIASRLARDGEGYPIGFDTAGQGGLAFKSLVPPAPDTRIIDSNDLIVRMPTAPSSRWRIVNVGADLDDTVALARAIGFVAKTPARIVVLPLGSLNGPRGALLREAALRFPKLLFLVGLDETGADTVPPRTGQRSWTLANVVLIAAADDAKADPPLAELMVDVAAPMPGSLAQAPSGPGQRLTAALAGAAWTSACIAHAEPSFPPSAITAELQAMAAARLAAGGQRVLSPACR